MQNKNPPSAAGNCRWWGTSLFVARARHVDGDTPLGVADVGTAGPVDRFGRYFALQNLDFDSLTIPNEFTCRGFDDASIDYQSVLRHQQVYVAVRVGNPDVSEGDVCICRIGTRDC